MFCGVPRHIIQVKPLILQVNTLPNNQLPLVYFLNQPISELVFYLSPSLT